MQINILGIAGSPRPGNSLFLLEKALAAAEDVSAGQVNTKVYSLHGKTFQPCVHCYACQDKLQGKCVLEDAFQELRELWVAADGIIYSVPVYHLGIPGQLKCFLDRLGNTMQSYYRYIYQLREGELMASMKAIGSIAQGMHIFSGQEHALTQLINHALMMGAVPVAGDIWDAYTGAGGWTANNRDQHAMSKLYAAGDTTAGITVRASESVGKRVAELCFLLAGGAADQIQYFQQKRHYVPLLRRMQCG